MHACSTHLNIKAYMSTLFFTGMLMNPTTMPEYPSIAQMCVTPNITSFSFWSTCNLWPKYFALYGVGFKCWCALERRDWWYSGFINFSALPTRPSDTRIPSYAKSPAMVLRPYVGPTCLIKLIIHTAWCNFMIAKITPLLLPRQRFLLPSQYSSERICESL